MYRPLIIVIAFLAVTVGLILFQPKPSPDRSLSALPEAPAPMETAVEAALEPRVDSEITVAVTRAVTPPISLPSQVDTTAERLATLASIRPVMRPTRPEPVEEEITEPAPPPAKPLYASIAATRPKLLTTTAQAADGTLVPSLGSIAKREEADQAALTAEDDGEDVPLPLEGVTDLAATLATPQTGNAALRAQLAQAPTRAVHTVRLGDSLLTLALRYYGDADKADMILEANRRHLGDGETLLIGQILRIPEVDNL
ncbi:MAG: LysM peptidoglycan-binding domain-containing protein [Pseudomonadota bacterium]